MTTLLDRPDLTVDFELMFGEMPEVPCEGTNHGRKPDHDSGPGTDYWRSNHDCWVPAGTIYVLCKRKTKRLKENLQQIERYPLVHCSNCGSFLTIEQRVSYVGPVNK